MVNASKVKVMLSLCLTKPHAMKTHWGVEIQLHGFLTSNLEGGEWSASRPGRFIPRERAPGAHWIGGWVGPRAVLDAVVKRKIPSPHRESNPRTPIIQPVAQRYTDWAITDLKSFPEPFNNIQTMGTVPWDHENGATLSRVRRCLLRHCQKAPYRLLPRGLVSPRPVTPVSNTAKPHSVSAPYNHQPRIKMADLVLLPQQLPLLLASSLPPDTATF
jgi:hypothetical protein